MSPEEKFLKDVESVKEQIEEGVYYVNVCAKHAKGKVSYHMLTDSRCSTCLLCQVGNCEEKAEYVIRIWSED